jgi:hypothetical protein
MKWFLVKYIYQIISGEGTYQCQFDEQQRIIKSDCLATAFERAGNLADGFHPCFKNYLGEPVRWKFVCIADLFEIDPPADGSEISSILHEPIDIMAYLNEIELRKIFLEQHILYR